MLSLAADGRSSPKTKYVLLLICVLIFVCCKQNRNHYAVGDSYGTLLVSQALLEHGSIRLDPYADRIPPGHQFQYRDGHVYYFFPIGTSIIAMPMAALALAAGKDMLENNRRLQATISRPVNIAVFLLLFLIGRRFLNDLPAALIAGSFWLSTSLSSVLGTALWSHNFAMVFALTGIWLVTSPTLTIRNAFVIGLVLFLSYLCRPTLSLLAVVLVLFTLARKQPLHTVAICAAFAACMLTFMRFSWQEFGQLLPDYYLPKRLTTETFGTALYGNMLSPARGFLIYTPILLMLAFRPLDTAAAARRHIALWLAMLLWLTTHWIFISRFQHWWGGFSYGPRLMVDVLPAAFVLLVTTLSCWQLHNLRNFAVAALAVIVLAGSWMHVIQGLTNKYSGALWNVEPNIDRNPSLIFDWRYPQFLHNRDRHERRLQEFNTSNPSTPPG